MKNQTPPTPGLWLALPVTRHSWNIVADWHGERSWIAKTQDVYDTAEGDTYEAENAANALLMASAPALLSELRNVLRCYERDTVPTRRVEDAAGPGTLVKINDKTADRIRELVSRFAV